MSGAATISEQIALKETSPDHYTTLCNPDKMGNAANIAYGGCALAVGVNAAYQTVSSSYHCFSITGNYLGPTLTDRPLHASIRRLRDTRTFASRLIELSQTYPTGPRLCMFLAIEFQVQEPATLLTYSTPPSQTYPAPESLPTTAEWHAKLLSEGKLKKKMLDTFNIVFGLMARFYTGRPIPSSALASNLYGMASTLPTPQDHLPLTQKTTAEWVKSSSPLATEAENVASLAFYMDGALSFIPLSFSHLFLQDAAACSSLDFALRVFSNKVDFNDFHLKEMKTVTGGEGRTYSEGLLWNREGKMVASMTQMSVMRPHKEKAAL